VKAKKDLEQATQSLEVLIEDRPADLESAWQLIHERDKPWKQALSDGLPALEKSAPELTASFHALMSRPGHTKHYKHRSRFPPSFS